MSMKTAWPYKKIVWDYNTATMPLKPMPCSLKMALRF